MRGVYFADAFYWISLGHKRDAWHSTVVAWALANPSAHIVTTEEVLTEVLNWFAASGTAGRMVASRAVRRALANPHKEYSLVDCRSMVAMQSLGLTEVLSNDHHFTQEGFTVLFP